MVDDIITIEHSSASLGLTLNQTKSKVIGATVLSCTLFQAASEGLTEVCHDDSSFLGSPLSEVGVDAVIITKRCELLTLPYILKYKSAHDSLYLLENVVTIPQLMYILCTSPCFYSNELVSYDIALCETLYEFLSISLDDDS